MPKRGLKLDPGGVSIFRRIPEEVGKGVEGRTKQEMKTKKKGIFKMRGKLWAGLAVTKINETGSTQRTR